MRLLRLLFLLSIFLFVFLFSFKLLVFDEGFYKEQFEENNVYNKFGVERIDGINKELIGYFNNKNLLTTDFFTDREKLHLSDVNNLINDFLGSFYVVLFLLISLFLYFILTNDSEVIGKGFVIGSIFSIIVIIILFLVSLTGFDGFFTFFHLVSFDNNLWLLSPDSNLIQMFPIGFFQVAFTRILVLALIIAVVFIIIGLAIKRYPVVLKKEFYVVWFRKIFLE